MPLTLIFLCDYCFECSATEHRDPTNGKAGAGQHYSVMNVCESFCVICQNE